MQITLNIKSPMLMQYLIGSLAATGEGYQISSTTVTGTMLCALVRPAARPDAKKSTANSLTFSLPINIRTRSLRNKFLTITPCDERIVNTVLQREFDLTFHLFVAEGYKRGVKRKDIIEMFIQKYQLENIPTAFDTLAKKDYRMTLYSASIFGKKFKPSVRYVSKHQKTGY